MPSWLTRSGFAKGVLTALAMFSFIQGLAGATLGLDDLDLGPLHDRFRLTLDSTVTRTEWLGPLFSSEEQDATRSWTFAPLASYLEDAAADLAKFEFLYPIVTYSRFGLEYRLQVLQWLSLSGGQAQDGNQQSRATIFPFFFRQEGLTPEESYLAIFPFYGRLKNRFFRDDIHFVLFPLYSRTSKRGVVTENYFYPFFHLRSGSGVSGWQLWPILGSERREMTTRLDAFGETEAIGGYRKTFVLWPFYFKNDLELGTENSATQRVLLPFFSIQRSPQRDSATYFWPFGLTITEDRQKKYREWGAPWPLITFARGEGKTANRVWPIFGQSKNPTHQSDFYLWPLYKINRITSDPLDRVRTRILLFLYSDVVEKNTATGTAFHRTDLWPLFTARKDHNGNERLQLLAFFEPLVPGNRSVERTYSPLWSIWRSEKNAKTGHSSQSLLWNLYRRETTPSSAKVSMLFGAFRYDSTSEGKRWRVFFVPFARSRS